MIDSAFRRLGARTRAFERRGAGRAGRAGRRRQLRPDARPGRRRRRSARCRPARPRRSRASGRAAAVQGRRIDHGRAAHVEPGAGDPRQGGIRLSRDHADGDLSESSKWREKEDYIHESVSDRGDRHERPGAKPRGHRQQHRQHQHDGIQALAGGIHRSDLSDRATDGRLAAGAATPPFPKARRSVWACEPPRFAACNMQGRSPIPATRWISRSTGAAGFR